MARRKAIDIFGTILRVERKRLGLSLHKASAGIGISVPFLGQLETGKRNPGIHTVVMISEFYGLDFCTLCLIFKENP